MEIKEASKILRISINSLRNLCKNGIIKAEKRRVECGNPPGHVYKWFITEDISNEQYVNVKAVCTCLGVSDRRVRKLCENRRIQAIKIGGRWKINYKEVADLILKRLS